MNGHRQVVSCQSAARAIGLKRMGLCLPILVCPAFILIMASFLPHPGYRWLLASIAALLALPALPSAVALLKLLWTRREVILDTRERIVTERVRMPWRTVERRCTFDSVNSVWVVLDSARREWTLTLELAGGNQLVLSRSFQNWEALSLASVVSQVLGVRMQGRLTAPAR